MRNTSKSIFFQLYYEKQNPYKVLLKFKQEPMSRSMQLPY